MSKSSLTLRILTLVVFTLALTSLAQAQATRTWVSGVGDDVNPCSRTAPCKTFAGAISKTAASGEINALDPAGFGAVTITKNMTIEGTKGQGHGGILASLVNGVVVNDALTGAPNTIIVVLRNLSINGAGNGTNGIRYISGKSLHVEDCQIWGFRGGTGRGIDVAFTAGNGQLLTVKDTFIKENLEGIRLAHTAVGGAVNALLDNCRIDRNNIGVVGAAVSVTNIRNTSMSFNTTAHVRLENAGSSINMENNFLQGTPGDAVIATAGNVRISRNHITNNGTGLECAGGTIASYGDNALEGNGALSVGCPTPLTPIQKK